jgi:CRISPR system Cascade subunit CasD
MANTLFLRLEGPLQSWGERAHWSVRDTAPEPTKSGVVGLLACALGLNSDEDLRSLSGQLTLGIRCDRPGTALRDYHTVVGGFMTGEGKIKINDKSKQAETVVSTRYYLCDASFLAAIQGPRDLIGRLAWAVQNPVWPMYLGRRSCPPSLPPYEGEGDYDSVLAALAQWPRGGSRPVSGGALRAVVECMPGHGVRRRHEIVCRSRRSYGPRYTQDVAVNPPAAVPLPPTQEVQPCTSPN